MNAGFRSLLVYWLGGVGRFRTQVTLALPGDVSEGERSYNDVALGAVTRNDVTVLPAMKRVSVSSVKRNQVALVSVKRNTVTEEE
jgi:hypothetical protein